MESKGLILVSLIHYLYTYMSACMYVLCVLMMHNLIENLLNFGIMKWVFDASLNQEEVDFLIFDLI